MVQSRHDIEAVGDQLMLMQLKVGTCYLGMSDVIDKALAIIKQHADSVDQARQPQPTVADIPAMVDGLLRLVAHLGNFHRVSLVLENGAFVLYGRKDIYGMTCSGVNVGDCVRRFAASEHCNTLDVEFDALKLML